MHTDRRRQQELNSSSIGCYSAGLCCLHINLRSMSSISESLSVGIVTSMPKQNRVILVKKKDNCNKLTLKYGSLVFSCLCLARPFGMHRRFMGSHDSFSVTFSHHWMSHCGDVEFRDFQPAQ